MTPNTTKPGLPNYIGPDAGAALWVHHAQPIEYCYSFKERIAYILESKPLEEQSLRLAALTYIGADSRTHALDTARDTLDTAHDALTTAQDAYRTAGDALDAAWDAYRTTGDAYRTAWDALDTARLAVPWRELAAQYAPEVPYMETGELDFQAYNAQRKGMHP